MTYRATSRRMATSTTPTPNTLWFALLWGTSSNGVATLRLTVSITSFRELQKWLSRYRKTHKIKQQGRDTMNNAAAETLMDSSPQSHASILKGMLGISSSSISPASSSSSPVAPSVLGIHSPTNPSSHLFRHQQGSNGGAHHAGHTSPHPSVPISIPPGPSQHQAIIASSSSPLNASALHASTSLPYSSVATTTVFTAPREIHHKASLLSILNSSATTSLSTSLSHSYTGPSTSASVAPTNPPPQNVFLLQQQQQQQHPAHPPHSHRSTSIPALARQVSAPVDSARPDLLSILRGTTAAPSTGPSLLRGVHATTPAPPFAQVRSSQQLPAGTGAPAMPQQHDAVHANKQSSDHLKQLMGMFSAAAAVHGTIAATTPDEPVLIQKQTGNENLRLPSSTTGGKPRRRSTSEPVTNEDIVSNSHNKNNNNNNTGRDSTAKQPQQTAQQDLQSNQNTKAAKKKRDKSRKSEEDIFQMDSVTTASAGRDSPASSRKGKKAASKEDSRVQNGKSLVIATAPATAATTAATVDGKTPPKILKHGHSSSKNPEQQQQLPAPRPITPSSTSPGLPGQISGIQLQDAVNDSTGKSPMHDFQLHVPDLIGDKNWFVKE